MLIRPKYNFKERYEAFSGVAGYISQMPMAGEDVGDLYPDTSLLLALGPIIESLGGTGDEGGDEGAAGGEGGSPACPGCGGKASFIEQYDRWYCYSCEQYLPK
jgi:hypothetical protein